MAQTDRDMVVLKNETDKHRPFRSSFAVTSGVYYYEVIPVTEGEMRFGWATRQAELSWDIKIGDDKHSIGLELESDCYIYHKHGNKKKYKIQIESSRLSPTVIGCLIDNPNRQFHFYLNGHQMQSPDNVHFSTWPYYATVSLGSGQQCQLNFGQAPFKFAPKDIRFSDFYRTTSGDVRRYQMAETMECKARFLSYFWFVHPVIANQVCQFYSDPEQVKCDELVRQLEHIEHNQTTRLDHSVEGGRLVQSVIEVMQRKLTCDHDDRVGRLLKQMIVKIKFNLDSNFEEAKLLELLYLYYQLSMTSSNSPKCHNILTILLILLLNSREYFIHHIVNKFYNLDSFLSQSNETFRPFLNPKLFITDPLKMINILNHVESFPLPKTKRLLLHDSTLNWCCELFGEVSSVSRLYEPSCDLVRLQVGMWARWFRDHVMQTERHFPSQSTLDPEDSTEHIKLSSDCLSARNDYDHEQSVRSVCSVSSDIFYYEAVLITDGDMRIGWATKQTELNGFGIGWDEYSIGFNGSDGHEIKHGCYNFYDTSLISTSKPKPRWSVGDVVGCLIDCGKKIFRFYLNGKLVKCREKIKDDKEYSLHFSPQPYHAAVSLHLHQQVYLNLGQCPFRHAPSVPFRTFHQLSPSPPPPPLHSPRLSECYSLVQVLTKDRVELVFDDDEQKEFDQLAKQIEQSKFNYENAKLQTSIDRLRLLQSLVSVSEPTSLDSCLSVHANLVAHLLSESTSANSAFPDLVAQLLYPYFTLHLTNHTAITHRNVCIVLSCLVTEMKDFHERTNLHKQVLTYFSQIVLKCQQLLNEFLEKFSLNVFETFNSGEESRNKLSTGSKFLNNFESKRNLDLNSFNVLSMNQNLSQICQLVHLRQVTLDHLLNSNQINTLSPQINHESLNQSICNSHLKNFVAKPSADNAQKWQNVRASTFLLKLNYLTKFLFDNDKIDEEIRLTSVLIVLGNMDLDGDERKLLSSNEKFVAIVKSKRNLNLNDISIFATNPNLPLMRQIVFLSQWTFDHLLNSNQSNLHSSLPIHETLDPSNCSAHLKLSSDLLSARSDRNWQSVRSVTSLSQRRYQDTVVYYESTLVTSGPMRIGWASENVQMSSGIVGDDQYSIGFDGHNRCIWHRGRQYPISNVPQWSAGDVVGCMVLIKKKRFAFYLNMEPIEFAFLSTLLLQSPHFSSVQSYYAAASLYTFQQCKFNFSVAQLPPRRPSFRVLDSLRNSINRGCRHLVLSTGNVINSWINVGSSIEAGNVTSTYIPGSDHSNCVINADRTIKLKSTNKSYNSHKDEEMFDEHEEDELLDNRNKKNV